ncbi:hypothetical protein, conserved [Eimeria brunetti]|uniref:Uncharacterized protein n=1 Tax=Eimeria brunetti TaxID=51314 RepID=U6LXI1_9EIME|nr:hypothetical protein, conserved [Eimeria brunetti]
MDGPAAPLDPPRQGKKGSSSSEELLQTRGGDVKIEYGCSASWGGGTDALAGKEACGTSTTADSPPETSPVIDGEDKTLAASTSDSASDSDMHGTEEEHSLAGGLAGRNSSGAAEVRLSRSACAASLDDAQERAVADGVAAAAVTAASGEHQKSGKRTENPGSDSLLRSSGQLASKAWESARTHAAAAASATASGVATADFSSIKEATTKPLLVAASYIGLGSFLDAPAANTEEDALCKNAELASAAPAQAGKALKADSSTVEAGSHSRAAETSATHNGGGTGNSGWMFGRLRLPALTQWLCSANVACDRPLGCTGAVADAETELEGSEAEAAASEHLKTVRLASASAAAATVAGGDSVLSEPEDSCTTDGGTCCTPPTPRATKAARGSLLDACEQGIAAPAAGAAGEIGDGRATALSAEASEGSEPALTAPEKAPGTSLARDHGQLPVLEGEGDGMNEGSAKETADVAGKDELQGDQQQKRRLWGFLGSTLASSSRRSVDVVQQAATTAVSAAGAASRALDGLVVPLFGTCMQPTTHLRADSGQTSEGTNTPETAEGEDEGPGNLLSVEGEEGGSSQTDPLTTDSSETSSPGLLSELQRRQRALAEAVRSRSTNFLQHSVALTASSTLSEARYHLAEIVDTGGPEVSGVWAGVKVGLGIATLASGHLILGGAMVAVATSSLGSALLWGRHRQEVYEIMRGDYVEGEAPQASSSAVSEGEEERERGEAEEAGMLSGTAKGRTTDSSTETASLPLSLASLSPVDAAEEGGASSMDRSRETSELVTGPKA